MLAAALRTDSDMMTTVHQTVLIPVSYSECATKKCVSCSLQRNPQFELRGFCSSDRIDIKYMMVLNKSSDAVYDFLGWKRTTLSWSMNNTRWEFTIGEDEVIAHCNDTEEYPLGHHRWYFQSEDCHDPGESWREMSLHTAVPEGYFCCKGWLTER